MTTFKDLAQAIDYLLDVLTTEKIAEAGKANPRNVGASTVSEDSVEFEIAAMSDQEVERQLKACGIDPEIAFDRVLRLASPEALAQVRDELLETLRHPTRTFTHEQQRLLFRHPELRQFLRAQIKPLALASMPMAAAAASAAWLDERPLSLGTLSIVRSKADETLVHLVMRFDSELSWTDAALIVEDADIGMLKHALPSMESNTICQIDLDLMEPSDAMLVTSLRRPTSQADIVAFE